MIFQIAEHCSSQAEASANDVRDKGRVEQCLKDHVAQKKITASSNKDCFAVISLCTTCFNSGRAGFDYFKSGQDTEYECNYGIIVNNINNVNNSKVLFLK